MTCSLTHRGARRAAPPIALALAAALAFPQSATAQGAPPEVTVSPPLVQELIEWQEFTGQFVAVDRVELRARVSGYLESIHFDDGQFVAAGDRLFVIDPRPFEAERDSAAARLEQADARLELAESQLQRAASLLANGNIPEATYDERLQEVRAATAAIDQARADLRLADLNLGYTQITAPIAGRIGQREISIGNLVIGGATAGATLLTTIVSLDPIYFEFDMSEAYFLRYQRAIAEGLLEPHRDGGVRVSGRLFDETDWPLDGRVDFVDNRVDRSSGTIRMRAVFANPDRFLTPGQFGVLRLPGSPRYAAILLPDEAILNDQDRRIVLTVDADNVVVPRIVRPGPRELGLRVIREGLAPEDRVIINGLVRARPGTPVTPVDGTIELPEQP